MEEGHDIARNNTHVASHIKLLAIASSSLLMSIIALLLPSFHGTFTPLQRLAIATEVSKQWLDLAVAWWKRCPEEQLPGAVISASTSSYSLILPISNQRFLKKHSRARL